MLTRVFRFYPSFFLQLKFNAIGPRCHLDAWLLKTLFNIVEAPFKKLLNFACLCCTMMFRWTIKQPGIQKFWNLRCLYQNIYDWISPLNKRSGRPFILTQESMGEMSMVFLVSCIFSLFWSMHLMVLLRCNIFRTSFLHLIKDIDSM